MQQLILKIILVFTIFLSSCTTKIDTPPTVNSKEITTTIQDTVVINTQFGKVQGYKKDNILIWLGIPYAGDTSGKNRWQAPSNPTPWKNILDATKAGDVALQPSADGIIGSENALNLDIYRPNNNKTKLPVLVYIHGGNNQIGVAQELSGESFVTRHDAIVVSINYRLGPLGFNPLPALKTGNALEQSGNYTLLDINKALDWLQNNINNFGGDKNNITVSGFSAGGRSVMALLISPIFKDKFHKAISFSGGITIADEEKSQTVFAQAIAPLVVEDGVQKNIEQAIAWLLTPKKAVKKYLYSLDGKRLVQLMSNANIRMGVFPHLYNDGVVIPKEGFDTTQYNSVPLLMVTGEHEFSLFARSDPYFKQAIADKSINTNKNLAKQYAFVNKYGGQLYSLFNLQDSAKRIGPYYHAPIYGVEILFGDNLNIKNKAPFGSFHGVFRPLLDPSDKFYAPLLGDAYSSLGGKKLSALFQDYIFEFIKTGDPNNHNLPKWQAWQLNTSENILFLDANKVKITTNTNKQKQFNYEDVLNSIDKDKTITAAQKSQLLQKVLNGRWFSYKLDLKYNNLSDFDK